MDRPALPSRLTEALLETASGMPCVGVTDAGTQITLRHRKDADQECAAVPFTKVIPCTG